MKKGLFLLPLAGALVLSGCTFELFGKEITLFEKEEKKPSGGKTTPSGGDTTPTGGDTTPVEFSFPEKDSSVFIEIDRTDLVNSHAIEDGKTYPKAAYTFTTDEVTFNASVGVGIKTSDDKDHPNANFYYESNSMQFKRNSGLVSNSDAVEGATKITINWFATFASEGDQYLPKVKVGDAAGSTSTAVTANEATPVKGTKTGHKQVTSVKIADNEYEDQEKDAYFYQTTYTISGHSFFSVGDSGGATYIKSIWVHH